MEALRIAGKLSPKVLLVVPQQRLSWQYHHRRAEIWQVVAGPVAVATSPTDLETTSTAYACCGRASVIVSSASTVGG